jgi:hypothetical protein
MHKARLCTVTPFCTENPVACGDKPTHPNQLSTVLEKPDIILTTPFCSIGSALCTLCALNNPSRLPPVNTSVFVIYTSLTMSTTRTLFRSTRQIFQTRTPFFAQTQNAFSRSTARAGRRFQSTDAPAAGAATKSWAAQFWASPVGPKTVHFWYV